MSSRSYFQSEIKKTIYSFFGFLALIAAVFFLKSDIQKRIPAVVSQREDLAGESAIFQSLPFIQPRLNEVRDLGIKLSKKLIGADAVDGVFGEIKNLAVKNRLEINLETVGEQPSKKNIVGQTHFDLSLTGRYADISKFMESMEKLDYYIFWNNFTLEEGAAGFGASAAGRIFHQ